MKKLFFSVIFAVVFFVPVVCAQAPQAPSASAFTGAWVLDKEKSSIKDFPKKMLNYRMVVGESENLLNVKSKVEGQVDVEASKDRAADVGPNHSPGMVAGSTVGQSSGSTTSSAGTYKSSYGGTMALYFTPSDVTYKLDGKEVKVEIKRGEKVNGYARIKAKLDKSGKTLQLTTIRREQMPRGEMETTTWEIWKLSNDGKSLKFQRTVETPTARDELTMFLTKAAQ